MERLPLRCGEAVARRAVPALDPAAWRHAVLDAVDGGGRVAALFASTAARERQLVALLAHDGSSSLSLTSTRLEAPRFPSLAGTCPQLALFERELAEELGIEPEGHPGPGPLRFSRPDGPAPGCAGLSRVLEGSELHEVAVGPVHAGVIEPGHFRFQCDGEQVLQLEISLGYQHRGVEAALRSGAPKRRIHYVETAAGDTSVGHATAWCEILESLAGVPAPPRAHALRAIALELERLANHTGDLGALAADVGFLPTASYCGRLRGEWLNLTAELCGSRFGRGLVRPGGTAFDVDAGRAARMVERLDQAMRDLHSSLELLWGAPSVLARFDGTGTLSADTAREIGLVGPAARACGLARDARVNHPMGLFRFVQIPISLWHSGDVFARAWVRALEIERSAEFVRGLLAALPEGPVRAPLDPGRLAPERLCVALVEGWRGEICHVAETDAGGALCGYKIVDPSFHNWPGLELALRGQQISDFPLCNKSFNLSYCGFDL